MCWLPTSESMWHKAQPAVLKGVRMPRPKLYQPPSSLPVKPDPPESVVAKPVTNNPRRLEVSWQNPSSWPDPESFPLKFFLRYRPLILDQWQHVSDAELAGTGGRWGRWWLGTSCTGNKWLGTKKKCLFTAWATQTLFLSFSVSPPFSLPLHLSFNSHSAYKWLCRLSPLCIFIHGPYLLSIHMFYIKPANEM